MKKLYALTVFAVSISLFTCKEDDGFSRNCSCRTDQVVFTVGNGKFFLPNVFSPTSDGINDFFSPWGNAEIAEVEEFVIRRLNNDVMFSNENFSMNTPNEGWDATDGDDRFLGDFKYYIRVRSSDGTVEEFDGTACSFDCENGVNQLDNIEECRWGTQYDGEGDWDETAPSLESDLNGCI